MTLLTCPECTHKVSDKAFSCPGCGSPMAPGIIPSSAGSSPSRSLSPICRIKKALAVSREGFLYSIRRSFFFSTMNY